MTSFTQKILRISITLADGATFADKSNTLVLQGLRAVCDVKKAGHPAKNTCTCKIYGMTQEHMNIATVIPNQQAALKYPGAKKVFLKVEAGDASGLSLVYQGEISEAWTSYQSPPNMYFHIESMTGYYPVLLPAAPRGYQGGVDAATMIADIAESIGYGFENNGFTAIIQNPYLTGTAIQQINQIARAAKMEIQIDDMVIYISPKNTPRKQTGQIPLISAATGMKEYPIFGKHGLKLDTLYNSGIVQGGQIFVQSDVRPANGYWRVNGLHHHLESNNPSGQWISHVTADFLRGA